MFLVASSSSVLPVSRPITCQSPSCRRLFLSVRTSNVSLKFLLNTIENVTVFIQRLDAGKCVLVFPFQKEKLSSLVAKEFVKES